MRAVLSLVMLVGCWSSKAPAPQPAAPPPAPAAPLDAAPEPEPGSRDEVIQLARFGFVTIRSSMPCKVDLDGTDVGTTPITRLPLAPGKHRVRLSNSAGDKRTYTVDIVGGKDHDLTVNW